jgi:aminoglycoside phosphotransferase (APT) family kinase protein
MNATIASLHSIDPAAVGLADYAAPRLRRAPGSALVEAISRRHAAGRLPQMDALVDWLGAHLPPDRGDVSVVHGDFRCDNMIFAPDEPRVLAVLDWELSTLGNPLADFVYHLMMYRMPSAIFTGWPGSTLPRSASRRSRNMSRPTAAAPAATIFPTSTI